MVYSLLGWRMAIQFTSFASLILFEFIGFCGLFLLMKLKAPSLYPQKPIPVIALFVYLASIWFKLSLWFSFFIIIIYQRQLSKACFSQRNVCVCFFFHSIKTIVKCSSYPWTFKPSKPRFLNIRRFEYRENVTASDQKGLVSIVNNPFDSIELAESITKMLIKLFQKPWIIIVHGL